MREMLGFSQEDIQQALQYYVQLKYKWGPATVSFEFTQSEVNGVPTTRVAAVVERLPGSTGVDPY